ncbi:hypothetical protein ILYODFUR_033199, partial [Ilyodon furcidens]
MQTHHCPGSGQLQWCHLQTSWVSQTGPLRFSCFVYREEWGDNTPLGVTSADVSCAGEDAPQSPQMLLVLHEAGDPLTGGGWDFELDELLVEDVWVDGAELKSTNRILAYIPAWSRCCRMNYSHKLTASSADLF